MLLKVVKVATNDCHNAFYFYVAMVTTFCSECYFYNIHHQVASDVHYRKVVL